MRFELTLFPEISSENRDLHERESRRAPAERKERAFIIVVVVAIVEKAAVHDLDIELIIRVDLVSVLSFALFFYSLSSPFVCIIILPIISYRF